MSQNQINKLTQIYGDAATKIDIGIIKCYATYGWHYHCHSLLVAIETVGLDTFFTVIFSLFNKQRINDIPRHPARLCLPWAPALLANPKQNGFVVTPVLAMSVLQPFCAVIT